MSMNFGYSKCFPYKSIPEYVLPPLAGVVIVNQQLDYAFGNRLTCAVDSSLCKHHRWVMNQTAALVGIVI